jgi:hypothetical protein
VRFSTKHLHHSALLSPRSMGSRYIHELVAITRTMTTRSKALPILVCHSYRLRRQRLQWSVLLRERKCFRRRHLRRRLGSRQSHRPEKSHCRQTSPIYQASGTTCIDHTSWSRRQRRSGLPSHFANRHVNPVSGSCAPISRP